MQNMLSYNNLEELKNNIVKIVKAAGSGSGGETLSTIGGICTYFAIDNTSSTNSLTFTINSITITVSAGTAFDGNFAEFVEVTITATDGYNWETRA